MRPALDTAFVPQTLEPPRTQMQSRSSDGDPRNSYLRTPRNESQSGSRARYTPASDDLRPPPPRLQHSTSIPNFWFPDSDEVRGSVNSLRGSFNSLVFTPDAAQRVGLGWTESSSISARVLDNIHRGPWFEIHRSFLLYVLYALQCFDGPWSEIAQLSKQWAEWDVLTSLANYRSVVQILFRYLTDLPNPPGVEMSVFNRLSEDISSVLQQMNSILTDRTTYQHFLNCRGTVAQQLLDLLQDLLDSSHVLASQAVLSKALLRLSGECGLHPTCFTLTELQRMGHQVAGGGFGDIWKGSVGGQIVAVKSMRQYVDDDVKASLKKLGREALIWRQLSHPNLLPFLGLYMLDSRLSLVSPWMENGDLKHFLGNGRSDVDRVSLILDVAEGLEYLHSKNVVHGDLKTVWLSMFLTSSYIFESQLNILVTPSGRACIADFGLSSIVDELSLKMTFSSHSGRGGTVRYQAPELLKNDSPNHFGSDVYAFACVCYEILTGKVPFFEVANEAAIIFKVIEGIRPSGLEAISPDFRLLIGACWHQEADKRPTMTAILRRLPIAAKRKQSRPDWDPTYSARFRRSVQEWPLLPSIDEIKRRIFPYATAVDHNALLAFDSLDLAETAAITHDERFSLNNPFRAKPATTARDQGFSWTNPFRAQESLPALTPSRPTGAVDPGYYDQEGADSAFWSRRFPPIQTHPRPIGLQYSKYSPYSEGGGEYSEDEDEDSESDDGYDDSEDDD
ncbi:kinase-like domain-containing protein [Mycena galopus ATCC 62051]|nr:kinase-like domain-containing protein [Mycena galopus ATCC 62051]